MSLFEGFETMRLVKIGPSLRERLERRIAAVHRNTVVARLRRFRQQLERDMEPEPWTTLEAPMVLLLSDVCDTLALDEEERAPCWASRASRRWRRFWRHARSFGPGFQ